MTLLQHLKIVSGGQTGVDRGALDGALAAGAPCGGWCPAGRKAEDGVIDLKYPLTEMPGEQYVLRTRQNVIDSDGTLVIYFGALEGGTMRTVEFCDELKKHCLQLDGSQFDTQQAAQQIGQFVTAHHIHTLNVAGPRASKQPKAHAYTQDVISRVLKS